MATARTVNYRDLTVDIWSNASHFDVSDHYGTRLGTLFRPRVYSTEPWRLYDRQGALVAQSRAGLVRGMLRDMWQHWR